VSAAFTGLTVPCQPGVPGREPRLRPVVLRPGGDRAGAG